MILSHDIFLSEKGYIKYKKPKFSCHKLETFVHLIRNQGDT